MSMEYSGVLRFNLPGGKQSPSYSFQAVRDANETNSEASLHSNH